MTVVCPVCHSRNPVESCLATEAGQAYMRLLLSQPDGLRFALARYILLFAPPKSEMSYDRKLRLAEETLGLDADPRRLAAALAETVEAIMAKRRGGEVRPLTKHNYLLRVLEHVAIPEQASLPATGGQDVLTPPRGKRATAIASLADWGRGDWLRGKIADGLAALVALGLDGAPGADVITRTADVWHHVLVGSCGDERLDSKRVQLAFSGLLKSVEGWPEPKAIWKHMSSRPQQRTLAAPPPSEEQRTRDKQALADIQSRLSGGMQMPPVAAPDEEARRRELDRQREQLQEEGL